MPDVHAGGTPCPACGVLKRGRFCESCGHDFGLAPTIISEATAPPPDPYEPYAPPTSQPAPPGLATTIRLCDGFSYLHEPLAGAAPGVPTLGDATRIDELLARLLHSRGGTFLITGFRGVGKTTSVMRTLAQAARELAPQVAVVPVVLNVGRPITTDQLLFAVVRRLFEILDDCGVLAKLPAETRQSLLVAYMRTSLSFKQTQTRSSENSASLELGGTGAKLPTGFAGLTLPKIGLSAKRAHSAATEAAFLAYSQTDVEHDLVRIVKLVNGQSHDSDTTSGPRGVRRRRFTRQRRSSPRVQLVVALDEMDKLTSAAGGLADLEQLLAEIKNVLAMPGVHFLLVAGVELHDAVVKDAARGNGVYESVIAWRQYVPCSWNAADALVRGVLEPGYDPAAEPLVEQLVGYLQFKARGVLRRLFQEFNAMVVWQGGAPVLVLGTEDRERIAFYARLQAILDDYLRAKDDGPLFSLTIDEDRWRLGAYYLVDWVLRSEGRPVTAADTLRAVEQQELDPLLRITQRTAERLLAHLADHRVLDLIRPGGAAGTIIGDVQESGLPVYKLAENVKIQLVGLARENEQERAALFDTGASVISSSVSRFVFDSTGRFASSIVAGAGGGSLRGFAAAARNATAAVLGLPNSVISERYEAVELLGTGGLGAVYRGRDTILGREVAIKVLVGTGDDPVLRARFAREARITAELDSPRIVRVYDVVEVPRDSSGQQAIIMEFIQGPTLAERIAREGPLSPAETVGLGLAVAEALEYLTQRGISRIDVKPSNIMLHPTRGPVVIDLGIAKRIEPETDEFSTMARVVVGTPAYMAPEQFTDARADARSDIYALGCTLYTCLTGKPPFENSTAPERFARRLELTGLPGSAALHDVIATATEPDPARRTPTPDVLLAALQATPEAQDTSPPGTERDIW